MFCFLNAKQMTRVFCGRCRLFEKQNFSQFFTGNIFAPASTLIDHLKRVPRDHDRFHPHGIADMLLAVAGQFVFQIRQRTFNFIVPPTLYSARYFPIQRLPINVWVDNIIIPTDGIQPFTTAKQLQKFGVRNIYEVYHK
ncbi:hypothetical protein T07_7754 [Trichinella nelsoni]|uniref:Uncharacterized protein n=1 Tax=Trichinella nelsoni TaxID=6336 RepID=A0A0V0SCJ0_9BILA|nr:hypothetical protein T07_7754 [Trichinella nelsoni]